MDAVSEIQGLGVPASRFLHNLVNDVAADERYSFVFDGNSQTLDQMLVSPALLATRVSQDIAHLNADYPDSLASDATTFVRASDHDAVAGTFSLATVNVPPTADAGTDPSVGACSSLSRERWSVARSGRRSFASDLFVDPDGGSGGDAVQLGDADTVVRGAERRRADGSHVRAHRVRRRCVGCGLR